MTNTVTRDTGATMNRITTTVARVRGLGGENRHRAVVRVTVIGVLLSLVAALLMTAFAPFASADPDEERDNYSLYQLASNASTYFSQKNSPAADGSMSEEWQITTTSPSSGGSLLGYTDPEFSLGEIVGWFFAEVSGSSQTIGYETLEADPAFSGMVDYAHFGAANQDLGLDTMSSGIGGEIMSAIGGSVMWLLYALALVVGLAFYLVIQILKLVNPFMWFFQAVSAVNPTFAEGMTQGGDVPGPLKGLSNFISTWYGTIVDISWQALVPLFIGFLIIGLVLFKKMDRGSAIKKLIVRIVFIGLGLPLIGSMYTGVLNKFDDSLLGQHSGPTRVVLSTYVDFDAWMMRDRLTIPAQASIGWAGDQADTTSMMSVRNSALAINVQSHPQFAGINVGKASANAETAWKNGTVSTGGSATDDVGATLATFGMLGKYITSNEVAASDFESGIKSSITRLDLDNDTKKAWFIDKKTYGDLDKFGEEGDPMPHVHPVISTLNRGGLSSGAPGSSTTTFTSTQGVGCGFAVWSQGAPAPCNMSPLAAYNYLNTGFDPSSMTMYSSNNATSGITRENHMAVSQVGTGPAKFMYWHNAATVLGSIALLGFWYAIGMLASSVKRTFGLVAAIPFATLGALAGISKVVIYSTALILEVIVSLFIYQFVSEFLISVPDIIAGPISALMTKDGLLGSTALGSIVVVIMTLVSSLLIMGVTIAMLRVRKTVLQAIDEVVTKLVDKFLDTNTAPSPDKGGLLPALAGGAGAGAGMALGNKLASGFGNKPGGGTDAPKGGPGGNPGSSKTVPTNAGGTNGPKELGAGKAKLTAGDAGGAVDAGGTNGPIEGGGGGGGNQLTSGTDDSRTLTTGRDSADAKGEAPGSSGGRLALTTGQAGSSHSDKQTAQGLTQQGGLSNLGYSGDAAQQGSGARGVAGGGRVIEGEVVSDSAKFAGGSGSTTAPAGGSTTSDTGSKGIGTGSGQNNPGGAPGRKRLATPAAGGQAGSAQQGNAAMGRPSATRVGVGTDAATPQPVRPGQPASHQARFGSQGRNQVSRTPGGAIPLPPAQSGRGRQTQGAGADATGGTQTTPPPARVVPAKPVARNKVTPATPATPQTPPPPAKPRVRPARPPRTDRDQKPKG